MTPLPTVTTLGLALVLATLVEMLVEYLVKPLIPAEDPHNPVTNLPFARYAAAAAGIAVCVLYRVDLLAYLIPGVDLNLVGMVLTGLLISRGSNYLHDWIGDPRRMKARLTQ